MKCGNKGSETKQWQQGHFIPVVEVRFEGHGKIRIQSPNKFRKWERREKKEFWS